LNEVYGWTPDYCLKKLSLPQIFFWHDRAMLKKYGKAIKKKTMKRNLNNIVDEINSRFKRVDGRWV